MSHKGINIPNGLKNRLVKIFASAVEKGFLSLSLQQNTMPQRLVFRLLLHRTNLLDDLLPNTTFHQQR